MAATVLCAPGLLVFLVTVLVFRPDMSSQTLIQYTGLLLLAIALGLPVGATILYGGKGKLERKLGLAADAAQR